MLPRTTEREANYISEDDHVLEDNYEEDEKEQVNLRAPSGPEIYAQDTDRSFLVAATRTTAVRVKKLQSMMRSKHDMYHVLHAMRKFFVLYLQIFVVVGINLPDYQHCPIQFMRDIMSGNKKVGFGLMAFI